MEAVRMRMEVSRSEASHAGYYLALYEEFDVPVRYYWLIRFGCGEDWGRVG